ncbi:hypothetical protein [Allosphingosinicella vermicomposti]|uniref:hypothetical protein n=1 Tax=Allosphingosinicella vermicomposti TaxID=614671 RepID=UPI000D112804|nr:hypothetical protein [Allosphingosinicella vermicomposti]
MALSRTLPIMLGLAVSGALVGVYAGRAALGEIPAFYADYSAAYTSFGSLVPNASGPADDEAGLGTEAAPCIGCDATGTGQYPWTHHAVFSDDQLGIADEWPEEPLAFAEPEFIDMPPSTETQPTLIDRYSHYPVTAEDRADQAPPEPSDQARQVAVAAAACEGPDCVPVGM